MACGLIGRWAEYRQAAEEGIPARRRWPVHSPSCDLSGQCPYAGIRILQSETADRLIPQVCFLLLDVRGIHPPRGKERRLAYAGPGIRRGCRQDCRDAFGHCSKPTGFIRGRPVRRGSGDAGRRDGGYRGNTYPERRTGRLFSDPPTIAAPPALRGFRILSLIGNQVGLLQCHYVRWGLQPSLRRHRGSFHDMRPRSGRRWPACGALHLIGSVLESGEPR